MRLALFVCACLAGSFGGLHGQQGRPLVSQSSMGVCSPNISKTNGNVTIVFSGSACAVDPDRLRGLEEFLKQFPKVTTRLQELLDKKDVELASKIQEAEEWAAKYRALKRRLEEQESGDDLSRQAGELLANGDPAGAGKLLDQVVARDESRVTQSARNHFNRAIAFELEGKFAAALPHFETADRYRPGTFEYASAYATLLHQLNRHQEAEPVFGRVVEMARQTYRRDPRDSNRLMLASALNHHAMLLMDLRKSAEAESTIQEELKLVRQSVNENPRGAGRAFLVMALRNLSEFYTAREQWSEALAALEECLTLFADASGPLALTEAAGTLNNIGVVYSYAQRKADAINAFRKSIQINEAAIAKTPSLSMLLKPWIGNSWMNLGNVYREIGNVEEAGAAHEKALSIYRPLAEANHAIYDPKVADVLGDLGLLQAETGKLKAAAESFMESLSILRRVSASNAVFLPKLARALINLGRLHRDMRQLEAAADELNEGLKLYQGLAAGQPGEMGELAWALSNVGQLLQLTGDRIGAEAAFQGALVSFRKLALINPLRYRVEIAGVRLQQGLLFAEAGRRTEADQAYAEGLSILRDLAKGNPLAHGKALYTGLMTVSRQYGLTKAGCGLAEEALRAATDTPAAMIADMTVTVCRAVVLKE